MKLNDSFLGVLYETDPKKTLKDFFIKSHLDEGVKEKVMNDQATALLLDPVGFHKRLKMQGTDWWGERCRIATSLVDRPKSHKTFYLTPKVQEEAELIKFDKIDLKWFNDLTSKECTYITGKNEFYRFNIEEKNRINVLNYRLEDGPFGLQYWYDSYSILLGTGELATLPTQKQDHAMRFVKYLLYVELADVETVFVKARLGKFKYGKKGDDKIKNESDIDVVLVNSNWNRALVMVGESTTSGHFRVQPYGPRENPYYRIKWISEYTRGSFVKKPGKEGHEDL
jgi:hypothetical protein